MRKSIHILGILLCFLLLACHFPLWAANSQNPDTQLHFRTQIPHNVNFPTMIPTIVIQPSPPALGSLADRYTYKSQSGDTLKVVSRHFNVDPIQVSYEGNFEPGKMLPVGTTLFLPKVITDFYYSDILLPDSEVIFSPSANNFNVEVFINQAGGYLAGYVQKVSGIELTGAQIVQRVAENTSVNPRLLLAFIELRSQWVTQIPGTIYYSHPLDLGLKEYEGLYLELSVAARYINTGYYGWRYGEMTDLVFSDGSSARIAPNLNPGTVGIQYLLAQLYNKSEWETMMYGPAGLFSLHQNMFGNPFERSRTIEPLFNEGTFIPELQLPFGRGQEWALTGGLHYDWTYGTPRGALDFAPLTGESVCAVSKAWVLASAPGTITRAANNQVILALEDAQGQPTGWEILFMHIASEGMIEEGTHVNLDDQIGHPSCQGGSATGTHVHIARKYKGEWIGAGEPFPFELSGWLALPGAQLYKSSLIRNDQTVTADPNGAANSRITR
jgi:hypothetical protein